MLPLEIYEKFASNYAFCLILQVTQQKGLCRQSYVILVYKTCQFVKEGKKKNRGTQKWSKMTRNETTRGDVFFCLFLLPFCTFFILVY